MLHIKNNPQVVYIVLHHTAVSRKRQQTQLQAVNTFHKNKDWGGGWKQKTPSELGWYVGYNFFCEPLGVRTQTRIVGEETLANKGMNCDVPGRCTAISYAMAGDFRVEQPTQHQVNDFMEFIEQVRAYYPNVQVVQHKDIQNNRTCAALTTEQIANWSKDESKEIKDQTIQRLIKERNRYRAQAKQLVALLTRLLKIIN